MNWILLSVWSLTVKLHQSSQFPPGFPGGLFWVPYYFCFTSMTCSTISIPTFASLRTIPRCAWQFKDRKTQPPFKMTWKKLQEWEQLWDMEFNPSKCQVLHIPRSRKPIHRNYTMHDQVLESVDHARYLGVDISSDLNFSHHINRITANASKSLGFLKRNIKTKHSGIRKAAYKTVVKPQLEYASPIWSPYTKKRHL